MKQKRQPSPLTVGLNSSLKLIRSGNAAKVFIANDCAVNISDAVREAAAAAGCETDASLSMAELGRKCGIDVGCAVFAVRR